MGNETKAYYTAYGPDQVPVEAFTLWGLFQDALDPVHGEVGFSRR